MSLVPAEAAELRRIAAARLAGASWRSEVLRLDVAGVVSTTGRPWTIGTLRRTITSPYVAGLRAYKGEVVGPAAWPPILDRETWDQLRADKAASHPGRPFVPKYLLSGLLTCSSCGHNLYATPLGRAGRVNYRCVATQSTKGRGCGKIHIAAGIVEQYVLAEVRKWLVDPVFAEELDAYLAYGDADPGRARARTDLEEIERRQKVLARRWAAGDLSDAEYEEARKVLARRHDEADARVIGAPRRLASFTAAQLLDLWDEAKVPRLRSALSIITANPIAVAPGRREGAIVPVAERVRVVPAWTTTA